MAPAIGFALELEQAQEPLQRDVYLHVSVLPVAPSQIPLTPKNRQVPIAVRDVLAGNAWQGARCKVAPPAGQDTAEDAAEATAATEGVPFSYSYLGGSGVAAYGVA